MNKKRKLYFDALLIGTSNALISDVTLYLVLSRNGAPFVLDYEMPYFVFMTILSMIPLFMIQFWVISLIIMALVNRLRQKVNPYLIVLITTILITSAPILTFLPSEFWADLFTSQAVHLPIYILTSTVINLLGFHLLFKKIKTIDTEIIVEKKRSGIYFNSLVIGTINGIACGIVVPVYQFFTKSFQYTNSDYLLMTLISIAYLFLYLIQFWITSLIITFTISRIKRKPLSYIFILAISLFSALGGAKLLFGSTGFSVISEGVSYVPIYVIITMIVFLLGYRRMFKKFDLNNTNSQMISNGETLVEK